MAMGDLRGPTTGILSFAVAIALVGHMADLVGQWELDMVGVASLGWIVFRVIEASGRHTITAGAFGAVSAGGLVTLKTLEPSLALMPYLLLVPANLFVAWMFARGLFPGREPVLLTLIRLMKVGPVDDPRFRAFVRGQCVLWTVLALANVAVGLAAVPLAQANPWIADLLMAMGVSQVLWFAISHHYAGIRYGRRETWWTTARAMARPDILSRLTAP